MIKYIFAIVLSICFLECKALINRDRKIFETSQSSIPLKANNDLNVLKLINDPHSFREKIIGFEEHEIQCTQKDELTSVNEILEIKSQPPLYETINETKTVEFGYNRYTIDTEQIKKIIKGQKTENIPPLFQYIQGDENLSLNNRFIIIMRHAETPASSSINPDLSKTPIDEKGIEHCNLYGKIIGKDSYFYIPATVRNCMTASAILGWHGKDNWTINLSADKCKQCLGIIEISLGEYEQKDKRDTLQNEQFIKGFNELGILDGSDISTGLELLRFSVSLSLIVKDKIDSNKMKIVIGNSAMMGLILNTIIKQYRPDIALKDIIPNNLDFMCLSLEKDTNNMGYFRIYDEDQVKQIFRNDNSEIEKYISPSIFKKKFNEEIIKIERESTKLNGKNILLRLKIE